jgi:hypothetical protein
MHWKHKFLLSNVHIFSSYLTVNTQHLNYKKKWLIMFTEIIAVYYERDTKQTLHSVGRMKTLIVKGGASVAVIYNIKP